MIDTNAVMQAISEHDEVVKPPTEFTTSNGVVLKLKAVPPLLVMDVQRRFVEPVPPKVRNFDKGEGDDAPLEENPSDPGYQRALNEHRQTVGEASNAIFIVRGTEIVSIPDGVSKVEDPDWAEDIGEFTGIDVPAVGRRRYYAWMKYVALASMDDFQNLLNRLTSLGGVTLESDVTAAEETFRPAENGGTDPAVRAS